MAALESVDYNAVLAGRARVPDNVVYRTFVYETVVLNLESGKYHGLNQTAGRMLELLERSSSVGEAAAKLANELSQPLHQIEVDICELCVGLAERGLINLESSDDH
jgi:Coenzyme PQQ synthesis protein D (PqqD).